MLDIENILDMMVTVTFPKSTVLMVISIEELVIQCGQIDITMYK